MIDSRDDGDLERRFSELRRRVAAQTPSFHATVSTARARARRSISLPRFPTLAAVTIAVLLAVVAIQTVGRVLERRAFLAGLLSSERWTAPTDFLLGTPGAEFLRTVPPLGSVEALVPPATLNEGSIP